MCIKHKKKWWRSFSFTFNKKEDFHSGSDLLGTKKSKVSSKTWHVPTKGCWKGKVCPLEELQVIERGLGYELTQATKSLASAASLPKPGIFVHRIFVHRTFVCQYQHSYRSTSIHETFVGLSINVVFLLSLVSW